jgi:transcriptional regulator GlxA family with amidase domain
MNDKTPPAQATLEPESGAYPHSGVTPKGGAVKTIGIYLWPNMTSIDVLAPHQFFGYVPDFELVTVAKTKDPVVTDTKLRLLPDHDFSTCPPIDVLLVGGGPDPSAEMSDRRSSRGSARPGSRPST